MLRLRPIKKTKQKRCGEMETIRFKSCEVVCMCVCVHMCAHAHIHVHAGMLWVHVYRDLKVMSYVFLDCFLLCGVWGQPGPQMELQARKGYTVRLLSFMELGDGGGCRYWANFLSFTFGLYMMFLLTHTPNTFTYTSAFVVAVLLFCFLMHWVLQLIKKESCTFKKFSP